MSFHTEVEAVCVRMLKEVGFQRKKGRTVLPLYEGWQGWVGLNSSGWTPRDGIIYPIIGVICDEVQSTYYDVQPELPGRNFPTPTITMPLGYAADVPELRQWIFTNDGTVEKQAADLTQAVVDIGIPYMRRHASLDAIRKRLSGDNIRPTPFNAEEKLAVTILVQDGYEAARTHIKAELAKISGKEDPSSQYYRTFAEKFLAYLDRTAR